MNACPCCSRPLLRHIRNHHIYWFCSSCWQEMPNLEQHAIVSRMLSDVLMPRLEPMEVVR